jgi:hypothetical protein
MMMQFRVEVDSFGTQWIYCRDVPYYGTMLERLCSMRSRTELLEYMR